MNFHPLITVIIPTYNEKDLSIAIESIQNQTYQNLEILVVDDGSTDNTKDVVVGYSAQDSRVKYLFNPHSGGKRVDARGTNISVGYLARNLGMDQAKGEWITFQDADDASLLNRIETQYVLAQKYNAICVTTSWQKFQNAKLGKSLNVERIVKEHGEEVITPNTICDIARATRGPLMKSPLRSFIPFTFKKRWPTRWLFIPREINYPGADNSPLFKRETIKEIRFRSRDDREWPSLGGRGVGRDHLFQMALKYNRSYSFKLPLYLWRQKHENPEFAGYEKYLL